jgi:hypothetical protein
VEHLKYLEVALIKLYSGRNEEQAEIRGCWLSFGAESFIFKFAIKKFKD